MNYMMEKKILPQRIKTNFYRVHEIKHGKSTKLFFVPRQKICIDYEK
jgi:hypothetical protein